MINRLSGLFSNPTVLAVIRIGGAGLGFATQCILAWILPPQQLGIFYSVTSLAAVMGIVAAQGYPQIAVRFTARYRGVGGDRLFSRFVGHALSESMIASALGVVVIVVVSAASTGLSTDFRHALWIASVLVIAVSLLNVMTNLAAAMKRFGICYIPEGLFRPLSFLAIIGCVWATGVALSAALTTAIFTAVTFAVAAVAYVMISRHLPRWQFRRPTAHRLLWRWRSEAWKLILLSMFNNFFVDTAILSVTPFMPSHDVAVFGLIMKMTMLAGYVVQVAQQIAIPDIAQKLGSGQRDLRQHLRIAILGPTGCLLVGLAVVAIMGREMLSIFGPGFVSGEATCPVAEPIRSRAGRPQFARDHAGRRTRVERHVVCAGRCRSRGQQRRLYTRLRPHGGRLLGAGRLLFLACGLCGCAKASWIAENGHLFVDGGWGLKAQGVVLSDATPAPILSRG
ncbi:MAG: oligosaccharide flippase family protein [Pseudolabrys sp.]